MRIHRTQHTNGFAVLPNTALRDRRLSFSARGILAYLLSLPDGAREDVRTLADRNPGLGRRGVSKAVDELIEHGYYVRRTWRDAETGRVRTETFVFDVPQDADSPLPSSSGTGRPGGGETGTLPSGVKNLGEEPSPTRESAVLPASDDSAAEGGREASQQQKQDQDAAPEVGRAAAVLGRLGAVEPKLSLGAAEVLKLAPLAAEWLRRGVSELELRGTLVAGLPASVNAPAKLVANRLERKMPAPRRVTDPAAPAVAVRAECGECGRPLPLGQPQGICGQCAGVEYATEAERPSVGMASEAASLIEQIRQRRATGAVKGSRRGFATA
ncbi:helix-turn-helix domain-containing protein [Streptomyces sp. NPDC007903]|uniref:helix-turn-helix domain-containing protein n=1 Tax=Streptomyces sp. NPDC007903 TaxID=3364786 RepID=UPI0036E9A8A6